MPYQMWINGEHTTGLSGKVIEVRNPATEEIVDTAPAANVADVERTVSSAGAAFPAWKRLPAAQKAEMLHEVAQKLIERAEEFARLLTLEGGKPLIENTDEMGWFQPCSAPSFRAPAARGSQHIVCWKDFLCRYIV